MMWNNKNIFEPSGCLSREAFEAYIKDTLPGDVKVSADAHIAGCEFCTDAIEGYNAIKSNSDITAILQKAEKQFSNLVEAKATDKKNKRILWTAVSAAASILIIIGLFNILNNQEPIQQIAQNKETEADSVNVILAQKPSVENKVPANGESKKETPSHISTLPVQTIADNEIHIAEAAEEKEEAELSAEPLEIAGFSEIETTKPVMDTITETRDMAFVVNEKSESPVPTATRADFKKSTVRSSAKAEASASSDEAFMVTDNAPKFKNGGVADFQRYIQSKIGIVTDSTTSTKVYVQFNIDENGRIKNPRILKGKNAGYEAEIINEVKGSPRWVPARQNGKAISTQLIIVVFIDEKSRGKF
jgi:cytoskeletal protein RodZ